MFTEKQFYTMLEGYLCTWGICKSEREMLESTLQLDSLNSVYK